MRPSFLDVSMLTYAGGLRCLSLRDRQNACLNWHARGLKGKPHVNSRIRTYSRHRALESIDFETHLLLWDTGNSWSW